MSDTAFPVPLSVFVKSLNGTSDAVYSHILGRVYGAEKHTMQEWSELVEEIKQTPVPPAA